MRSEQPYFPSLFGERLLTDFPFVSRLARHAGSPSLRFDLIHTDEDLPDEGLALLRQSGPSVPGADAFTLVQHEDGVLLRFVHRADFYLWPQRILCHLLDPAAAPLVEIHFLGTMMALWLELRGLPALHASAVVIGGRAIAFTSSNGGGKSSLAAALMQGGHPLLTDDILPIERAEDGTITGRPGYPTMRLWPDEALHFLGRADGLPLVHPQLTKRRAFVGPPDGFGTFQDAPAPLACLYLPERREPAQGGTQVEITPVSQAQAVIELVRHSFVARLAHAAGLQPQRLRLFAELVRQVPVRRLIYPSGFEHLPRVRDAVLALHR